MGLSDWVQEGGREGARLCACACVCVRGRHTHTPIPPLPSALVRACVASGGWTGQVLALKPGTSPKSTSAA